MQQKYYSSTHVWTQFSMGCSWDSRPRWGDPVPFAVVGFTPLAIYISCTSQGWFQPEAWVRWKVLQSDTFFSSDKAPIRICSFFFNKQRALLIQSCSSKKDDPIWHTDKSFSKKRSAHLQLKEKHAAQEEWMMYIYIYKYLHVYTCVICFSDM